MTALAVLFFHQLQCTELCVSVLMLRVCVCVWVSDSSWHSCSFAQKSDTIMTGPSVHLSVCVRERLLVSVLDSERESWMENWHQVYNGANVVQFGWTLIGYSHDWAELYLESEKSTRFFTWPHLALQSHWLCLNKMSSHSKHRCWHKA